MKWSVNMVDKIFIEVPRDLTSYEFYNNLLLQLNHLDVKEGQEIVFDFSRTFSIEPLTIPNLLCLGYKIKKLYMHVAKIFIPDMNYSGEIKNYLNEIGFVKYAERYGLFTFVTSPYGGISGKKIDPICGSLYFDINNSVDEINRGVDMCISPFANRYLSSFENMCIIDDKVYYGNEITEFLEELILNCKIHARSFSFITMHAKYSVGRIFIAVSDYGLGFKKTMTGNITYEDEASAILAGVYKRKNSKVYGLFNVIRRILEYDGKVRIHSNDTQIVFTPRIMSDFLEERLLINSNFNKYNIKRGVCFKGAHIEMEIPLERRK